MSCQSSLEHSWLYRCHNAIYESVIGLIGWHQTLRIVNPRRMKNIELMCWIAGNCMYTGTELKRTIVTVMDVRYCMSVAWLSYPRLLWVLLTSILSFQYRVIISSTTVFLYFISVYVFLFLRHLLVNCLTCPSDLNIGVRLHFFFSWSSIVSDLHWQTWAQSRW